MSDGKGRTGDKSLASERAYAYIRDGIYSEQFKPGQTITEDEVASVVGVSRTPVREAIRRASADGLLEQLEGFRRARVTRFTEQDSDDLFEVRAALEAMAAERAARHITPAEIARLEELAAAMEEATDSRRPTLVRDFNDFNIAFHTTVLTASRSRQVIRAAEHLVATPTVLLRRYDNTLHANLGRTNRHHRGIITALKVGDPKWAAAEMTVHIISSRSNLL